MQVTHDRSIPREIYCGPAALSAALGVTAENVAATINNLRREPVGTQVRKSNTSEIESVLRFTGTSVVERVNWHRFTRPLPTLTQWMNHTALSGRTYILLLTGHWVTYRDGIVYDSHHNQGEAVNVPNAPYRRKRVRFSYDLGPDCPVRRR